MTDVEEKHNDAEVKYESDSAQSDPEKDEDQEIEVDKPIKKRGRGRPPKLPGKIKKVPTPGRGRGRPKKDHSKDDSPPAKKRKKEQKERTIQPGILRDTPRLSYKDDSSSGGEEVVERPGSSDGEADYQLEKKLSTMSSPKRDAGTLRTKPVFSYKDDSESDIESGFESDIINQHKHKTIEKEESYTTGRGRGRPKGSKNKLSIEGGSPPQVNGTSLNSDSSKRGRGRPKGSLNKVKRGRGRPPKDPALVVKKETPMLIDDDGEMVPIARGRGRPKGSTNKKFVVKVIKTPSGRPRGRPKGTFKIPGKGRGRPKGSTLKAPKTLSSDEKVDEDNGEAVDDDNDEKVDDDNDESNDEAVNQSDSGSNEYEIVEPDYVSDNPSEEKSE